MQNQRRKSRSLNLVDACQGQDEQAQQEEFDQQAQADYDVETEACLQDISSIDLALANQAAEINAFMQKRLNQRPRTRQPPRGRPTQPGRFMAPKSASAPARPPPRDRADVQCINCNHKGHTAQECRQPRVDKAHRKCFLCNKTGHLARDCKERLAPIQAVQQ